MELNYARGPTGSREKLPLRLRVAGWVLGVLAGLVVIAVGLAVTAAVLRLLASRDV